MARVLGIHPWIYDFAAYNFWIEPLGLMTVLAALRGAGHEAALIDCLDRHHPAAPAPRHPRDAYGCGAFEKVELQKPPVLAHVPRRWGRYGLPAAVFDAELAAQPRPDAVLVTSMMTYWYPGPAEVIRRVRARWPGAPVALGGIYATLCAGHARTHAGADAVLAGAGPAEALAWVNQVTGQGGALPEGDLRPAHDLRRPQGYVAVRTGRGCPFACPYCAVRQLCGPGWSGRPPQAVVDEIAWCAAALGARDVAFYDDALLYRAGEHIHPILDGLIARRVPVRLHTPNGLHARLIDRPLADKLRRAGMVTVRLGLETADPAQQARDGAKIDDASFARAVEALWEAGFTQREVAAYVLIGRPGQQIEEVRRTAAFCHALGVAVDPAEFAPVPGTAEWEAAVRGGYIAADADPLLHNRAAFPCGDGAAWTALKVEIREGNRRLMRA